MKRNSEQAENEAVEHKRMRKIPLVPSGVPPSATYTPVGKIKLSETPTGNNDPLDQAFTPFTQRQHNFLSAHPFEKQTPFFHNVYTIEGNIGSGKSTLLKKLEDRGIKVIQEPVDNIWQKFLPKLYGDVKRWGCTFQFEVFFWYQRLCDQILPDVLKEHKYVVIERSPHSSFRVFCRNLLNSGKIEEWEFDLLSRFFELTKWNSAQTIYLQVTPDTCVERIKQRNRDGECNIDMELLNNLHDLHEELFVQQKFSMGPVVVVDANQGIEKVCEDAFKLLPQSKGTEEDDFLVNG